MPLSVWIIIFICSSIVTVLAGIKISYLSEGLAKETGIGQALFGAIFLAASTSLPGLVTTSSAAFLGNASLAVSNGVGSIAAQTAFLAVADLSYKRANLEHAAASPANLFYSALLIVILGIVLVASFSPDVAFFHVSPFSLLMIVVYVWGMKVSHRISQNPMWRPVPTEVTETDEGSGAVESGGLRSMILWFGAMAVLLTAGGILLSVAANKVVSITGLSSSVMGAAMTGVVTSLPELTTTVTAARRGAIILAVSNIVGGNAFNSLFVAVGDLLFFEGSIFQVLTNQDKFLISSSIVITAVLTMGLVVREKHGWKGIGFESVAMLAIYFLTILMMF